MRWFAMLLIVISVAATGCADRRVDRSMSESSVATATAAVADAYPTARNSAADIAAARGVAASAVDGDIRPEMLRHDDSVRDEIPLQWWEAHDREPFRVVKFTAQSAEDLRRNASWLHVYVVVQERDGGPWLLLYEDEGV